MSNTRYINGYECPRCFFLWDTERKAKNCMKRDVTDYPEDHIFSKEESTVRLLKGHECIDCLKLHKKKKDAKTCCNVRHPEEEDLCNYDAINYPKAYLLSDRKKIDANCEGGENE